MSRSPAVLLAALLLGACATTGAPRIASDSATTLCVSNATTAYGTLRIYAGGQSMRIEPGQRECRLLHGAGLVGVAGSTIGGGVNGPVRVRDQIELDGGVWCWKVENVGHSFPIPCGDR